MEENCYNINKKEFDKISVLAANIYNMLVVIDYFCKNQQEIEELYNLIPIIRNLRKNANTLKIFLKYCFFYLKKVDIMQTVRNKKRL